MYVFNRITVNPQLPERINRLEEIGNNLWWSWNTDFLRLFKKIDVDLWNSCAKSPVKFLKRVSQDKLEKAAATLEFTREYDKIVKDFDDYMGSRDTWFSKTYPDSRDLIAYFSAEYGLDETIAIYSGGLGILSGDHLKSTSDLGIPFVAVGLLYKQGYFHQKINSHGIQENEYKDLDLYNMPILPVKNETGEDLIIHIRFPKKNIYLKVWQINVGRVKLYLLDSDIKENDDEYRAVTLQLYGGDREMRIQQEIILGMGGVQLLKVLGIKPTAYHMNEGHSSFVTLELIKDVVEEKKVSFPMANDIVSAKTIFTTHTPVPAGNDIFTTELVEKYFKNFWGRMGIEREEFLKLGMKGGITELETTFNMGILGLKIAGKKNGVSELHGEVSRELFSDIWPNIAPHESPITHVTNGVHTCSWLAPNIKELYNKYLTPYWQDNIHEDSVWKKVNNIPNDKLWEAHIERKKKLISLVKENITTRFKNSYVSYEELKTMLDKLNPNALTIGFARRFATYKRAALIFRDLERITKLLNDEKHPVQLIFAGKAHPQDKEGQDLIKYIHEISMMPQFKGKVFIIENYNIAIARYLVSGVDVWLNNPRRPMEASGTSGQKAAINGVINFSISDGWWAEGYNEINGWTIGTNTEYPNYEEQDNADSQSIYEILENKIIPAYYNIGKDGVSDEWLQLMKNSIISNAGRFSTARMLVDYTRFLYMPLCNITNQYYNSLEEVAGLEEWKTKMYHNWDLIEITQENNYENTMVNAGSTITVECNIKLPNMEIEDIEVQVYYGRISDSGNIDQTKIIPMELKQEKKKQKVHTYTADIKLMSGGNYGYTFRVVPQNKMILDSENLNLVKWIIR